MYRRLLTLLAVVALTGTILVPAAAAAGSTHQTTGVNWHAQQAPGKMGPVDGAWAKLVRNQNGISFQIHTNSLTPGNAYTLWLVVVNNPEACTAHPCTGPDIILNPDTDSQVRYAAGHVAGGSGQGTLAGSVKEGPLSGWLPDRSLNDSMAAEVQLVVNEHGPMLPEFMPGMIHTYRGGCSNESPFPPIFPNTALSDGEVGPNTCLLYQGAAFLVP
jgi:hypothetical protein